MKRGSPRQDAPRRQPMHARITRLALLIGIAAALASLSAPRCLGQMEQSFGLRASGQLASWSYDGRASETSTRQQRFAIDGAWQATRSLRFALGTGLVQSHQEIGGESSDPDPRSLLRWSVQSSAWDHRVAFALGSELWSSRDLRDADELAVAQVLEEFALEFPEPRPGEGSRLNLGLGVQALRTKSLSVQLAGGFESRGEYKLGEAGSRLDPGNRSRLALSARWVSPLYDARVTLSRHSGSQEEIDGTDAYRVGAETRLRLEGASSIARERLRASIELLGRADGEAEPGRLLDEEVLRSGNRLRYEASVEHPFGDWRAGLGVVGNHLRGFAGQLGHVDWVAPQATLRYLLASSEVSVRLRVPVGKTREDFALHGTRVDLGWGWGILR